MKTIYSKKNPPKWINGWISLEKTLQYLVCPCYKSKVGRKIAEISLITYQMLAWAHWILATQTPLNRTQTTITTTTTRTTTEKQTNLVVHPTAHIVMLLRIICMYHREKAWACGLNAIQITCQNAFQLLYHTFWCKFTHQHISLKFIYNVTLIFDCLLLAVYDDGCYGVLNHVHAQWLHKVPCSLLRSLHIAWAISCSIANWNHER